LYKHQASQNLDPSLFTANNFNLMFKSCVITSLLSSAISHNSLHARSYMSSEYSRRGLSCSWLGATSVSARREMFKGERHLSDNELTGEDLYISTLFDT
jgi:hypothetical protein